MLGSTGDYYYGAKLAVVGSIISLLLTFLLPSHIVEKPIVITDTTKAVTDHEQSTRPSKLWLILSSVGLLLAVKVITSVSNSMNATVFPLILKNTYGFDEKALGGVMSVLSGINAVVNAMFVSPAIVYLGGDLVTVIRVSLIAMFIGFGCQGIVCLQSILNLLSKSKGVILFLLSTSIMSAFQYLLSTTITAASTCRVANDAKGTLLGLEHSLFAAARVLSPQLGIMVLNGSPDGMAYVSFIGGGIYLLVILMYKSLEHQLITPVKKEN